MFANAAVVSDLAEVEHIYGPYRVVPRIHHS